jgi:hypothetical protein
MDVKKLCLLAREEIEAFAPGWNERRLFQQIEDIWRFGLFSFVIPMDRRRAIARLATDVLGVSETVDEGEFTPTLERIACERRWKARELHSELAGVGGLSGDFSRTLRDLAGPEAEWRTAMKKGGDRRSGERSLKGSVLAMAVRLYCDAHAKPGFSVEGPMCRFSNAIGGLALGVERPFNAEAVRHAHRQECRARQFRSPRRRPPNLSEADQL